MKKTFILSILLAAYTAYAQQRCHTDEYLKTLVGDDPALKQELEQAKSRLLQNDKLPRTTRQDGSAVYTIPVVVHIVYSSSVQNISDEQVYSQIEVLNEDYSRTNADASETPDAFADVAASPDIEFVLASYDENGMPTTGITRTETDITSWNLFAASSADNWAEKVKDSEEGGVDGWDRDCYLNIWVCNLSSGILGFSSFPGFGLASRDGVVICYKYFGRDGSAIPPFDQGRTTTHELGHWLGLYHTWGDDDFAAEPQCSGSDEMSDTPNQEDATYFCPSFPLTDNCTTTSPGVMFMNYMDYVDDDCMNMFTADQVNRMLNTMENEREELATCTKAFVDIPSGQNQEVVTPDVYPNPSSDGFFTVHLNTQGQNNTFLQVISVEGQLLQTVSSTAIQASEFTLNLSTLAKGVYWLRIFDGTNYTVKQLSIVK